MRVKRTKDANGTKVLENIILLMEPEGIENCCDSHLQRFEVFWITTYGVCSLSLKSNILVDEMGADCGNYSNLRLAIRIKIQNRIKFETLHCYIFKNTNSIDSDKKSPCNDFRLPSFR